MIKFYCDECGDGFGSKKIESINHWKQEISKGLFESISASPHKCSLCVKCQLNQVKETIDFYMARIEEFIENDNINESEEVNE